jgi:hypothetical protein
MPTLNDQVKELQARIKALESKINDLSTNVEEKYVKPTTQTGNLRSIVFNLPTDTKSGFGGMLGNAVIWNNSESQMPRIDQQPVSPTKSYNKHSHSRYSGGALIKDSLEIVEYDWTKAFDGSDQIITNKHSQQFFPKVPMIQKEKNTKNEEVDKIGLLDLIFNPDTQTWGVAAYEIDVKKCYFVQRDENGDIELDENGNEMKSPLWNEDTTKTSVAWDKNAKVFRIYAAYAPGV